MIQFTNVSFGFPQKDLYNKICFSIEEGEHALLIGSNGTGKSTLVDMIMNTDNYLYDGKIEIRENLRIGYMSQFIHHEKTEVSVYDYLAADFVKLHDKAAEACAGLENAEDMEKAYDVYQKCLDEIDAVDGYNYEANIKKRLSVAGLSEIETSTVDKISGGEFKLLSIIRGMLLNPQLLILDEPDVFLDFENIVGLSRLINGFEGTILAITHSRLLISQCFDKVLHLENEELQEFPGNFASYHEAMLETKIQMKEQATKEEEWIQIQQKLVERMRAEATKIDNAGKGKQLKARVSYLERLQAKKTKNPFIESHDYDFTFEADEEKEPLEVQVKDYTLSYDEMEPILKNVSFHIKKGEKVALVGANGTGKSSMLRDLYEMLSGEEGVYLFTQLYEKDGEKLSGGERNIQRIMDIGKEKIRLLLLDEPTSHLDVYAQMALERAIREFKGTVLFVSHDFYTVANVAEKILVLEDGTMRETSARAYRKRIYKKYFDSDIFETERKRIDREIRINELLKCGKYQEAKIVFTTHFFG